MMTGIRGFVKKDAETFDEWAKTKAKSALARENAIRLYTFSDLYTGCADL